MAADIRIRRRTWTHRSLRQGRQDLDAVVDADLEAAVEPVIQICDS